MNTEEQIKLFSSLARNGEVEIYKGIDAYIKPLMKREEVALTPIKQIINGELVAKYHKQTDGLVNKVISTRVEKGLELKNLIRQEDSHLEIERSNPETLKETKLLPKGFELDGIISVFGDWLTIVSLNESESLGMVLKDKILANIFHSIFDSIWSISEAD